MGFLTIRADQAAAEQQRKADQAANLQTCLDTAFSNHQSAWTTACTHIGIDSKGPDCSLPSYQAKAIEDAYTQAKADCFKQYPQN